MTGLQAPAASTEAIAAGAFPGSRRGTRAAAAHAAGGLWFVDPAAAGRDHSEAATELILAMRQYQRSSGACSPPGARFSKSCEAWVTTSRPPDTARTPPAAERRRPPCSYSHARSTSGSSSATRSS